MSRGDDNKDRVICPSCRLLQKPRPSCAFCGSMMLCPARTHVRELSTMKRGQVYKTAFDVGSPSDNVIRGCFLQICLIFGLFTGSFALLVMEQLNVGGDVARYIVFGVVAVVVGGWLVLFFVRPPWIRKAAGPLTRNWLSEVPGFVGELKEGRKTVVGTIIAAGPVILPAWTKGEARPESKVLQKSFRSTEGNLSLRVIAGKELMIETASGEVFVVADLDSCLVQSKTESWVSVSDMWYLRRFGLPYKFEGEACAISICEGDQVQVWGDEIVQVSDEPTHYRSSGGRIVLGRKERPMLIEVLRTS